MTLDWLGEEPGEVLFALSALEERGGELEHVLMRTSFLKWWANRDICRGLVKVSPVGIGMLCLMGTLSVYEAEGGEWIRILAGLSDSEWEDIRQSVGKRAAATDWEKGVSFNRIMSPCSLERLNTIFDTLGGAVSEALWQNLDEARTRFFYRVEKAGVDPDMATLLLADHKDLSLDELILCLARVEANDKGLC